MTQKQAKPKSAAVNVSTFDCGEGLHVSLVDDKFEVHSLSFLLSKHTTYCLIFAIHGTMNTAN